MSDPRRGIVRKVTPDNEAVDKAVMALIAEGSSLPVDQVIPGNSPFALEGLYSTALQITEYTDASPEEDYQGARERSRLPGRRDEHDHPHGVLSAVVPQGRARRRPAVSALGTERHREAVGVRGVVSRCFRSGRCAASTDIVADKFEERMVMEIWIGYRIELTATVAELDPLSEADPDQQPLITFTFSEGTMPITERVGLILYDSGELVPGFDGSSHYGWEEPPMAGQPPAVGRGTPRVIPDKLLGNEGPVSLRSLLLDRQRLNLKVSGQYTQILTRGQARGFALRLIVGVPRQLDNAQPPYNRDGADDDDRAILRATVLGVHAGPARHPARRHGTEPHERPVW